MTPVLPVATVVVPMMAAALGLWIGARSSDSVAARARQRTLGLLSWAVLLVLAGRMLQVTASGEIIVVRLGNWPSPFAITLVVDRLSALMVALTVALLAFVAWAAQHRAERMGPSFHPLLQFQAMGLVGAFMTGDLFNLFVFFEILLIASYALLLFGKGRKRLRAALHYIVLNLVGSTLFLIGVGVVYGLLGTLNFADLAVKAAQVSQADAPLLHAGALLLLLVFALKAAVVPVHLWLPATYDAPVGPVSALFSIMTKVGVYAIVRVFIPIFGSGQGWASGVAEPWILPLGLVTLIAGALGVVAATELKRMVTFLVVASVGTQLTAVGLFTPEGLAAAVYYMVHSTLLSAGLFLLADAIVARRGRAGGRLSAGPLLPQATPLALLYLLAAMSAVGMPPLSGFVSKVLLLSAVPEALRAWVWGVVLASSFVLLVQMARVGSVLFWNISGPAASERDEQVAQGSLGPVACLVAASVGLAVAGARVHGFAQGAAAALFDRSGYVQRVMTDAVPLPRTRGVAPKPPVEGWKGRHES